MPPRGTQSSPSSVLSSTRGLPLGSISQQVTQTKRMGTLEPKWLVVAAVVAAVIAVAVAVAVAIAIAIAIVAVAVAVAVAAVVVADVG